MNILPYFGMSHAYVNELIWSYGLIHTHTHTHTHIYIYIYIYIYIKRERDKERERDALSMELSTLIYRHIWTERAEDSVILITRTRIYIYIYIRSSKWNIEIMQNMFVNIMKNCKYKILMHIYLYRTLESEIVYIYIYIYIYIWKRL